MFLRYLYPALLWALLILILCSIPGPDIPRLKFLDWLKPDKIVHFVLFGALCFLLVRGFAQQSSVAAFAAHPKMYAVVLSSVYGIVIEMLQTYIFTYRSGDVFDAIADSVGAFLGLWLYNFWMRRKLIHTGK
jgi:VanZ family protein